MMAKTSSNFLLPEEPVHLKKRRVSEMQVADDFVLLKQTVDITNTEDAKVTYN
jgi:hypothetical protein